MKILVTGGAGFVGSVLVPRLLRDGHTVTVLDSLRYGGQSLLACFESPGFSFVHGDVRDRQTVARLVGDVDAVAHLAAIVGFPACRKFPELARETNIDGTRTLVEALSPQQSLIFASTGSAYGALQDVCTEESPLQPISLYALTKMEAEALCLAHPRATVLRFATGFGVSPRMRLDLLINAFVQHAIQDRQLVVYERAFRRTFIEVRDMARAVQFAVDHMDQMAGAPFNVGDESLNLTKEDVALEIRKRVPFYLHFADVGCDEDARDYEVSFGRIRALGFKTQVTLDGGLQQLIRAMEILDVSTNFSNV